MATPLKLNPRLSMCTRTVLAERVDAAATALGLDFDGMVTLQKLLLPEIFDRPEPPPGPADDPGPPGSHRRVTAMANRFRRSAPLFSKYDPAPESWRAAGLREWLLVIRLAGPDEYHAHMQARELLGLHKGDAIPEGISVERE
jgi:hypothetical protein